MLLRGRATSTTASVVLASPRTPRLELCRTAHRVQAMQPDTYLGASLRAQASSPTASGQTPSPPVAALDTLQSQAHQQARRRDRKAGVASSTSSAQAATSEVEPLASAEVPADVQGLFQGAMPKEEIGALALLAKHPTYDGRGVIIAIFDSGVDPAAPGLHVTTDGKPKILDVIDCTGSGDVDMSKIVEADADGAITGYGGHVMRVNPAWTNPTGKWRVGHKRAYDLFTAPLRERVQAERRKEFEKVQREKVKAVVGDLAAFDRENGKSQAGEERRRRRRELEARVKLLEEMMESWSDEGPMVHCVVWHDGDKWRAALDTSDMYPPGSEKGRLADFAPLTNYRDERRHGTFTPLDSNNFALNIYQNGDVLSIVTDASPHGTHVAAIAAAHHPEDPSPNGVAPGAQIISCKIGDSRLGSMETIIGLSRALAACRQHGADLINMSYGEAGALPDAGRFVDLARDIVEKHGVMFVASAGNAGPALSTAGSPGGTTSCIVSVGAYVSPALAAAGHSARDALESGQQYTWSSRGPTHDGEVGVTLSAPGGAVASVPQWTQQKRQLMNGTSMSSPNACGGIACVISGLKQEGQSFSPARVRRALENTCSPLGTGVGPWVLTSGRGMLRVDEAMAYLQRSVEVDRPDYRYAVRVRRTDSRGEEGRGLYLRDPLSDGCVEAQVTVEPRMREDADVATERCAIEDRLRLVASAPWVTCPQVVLVPHNGRSFSVKVEAGSLPPGLHYAEVQGLDAVAEWRGPLFRVPITVTVPEACNERGELDLGTLHFTGGTELRRFVRVPDGACTAQLRMTCVGTHPPRQYLVRATQLLPKTRYSDTEDRSMVALGTGERREWHVDHLVPGATLELTIGQYWLSQGVSSIAATIAFHGIVTNPSGTVHVDGSGFPVPLAVLAPLGPVRLEPSAKLTDIRIPVRPAESSIEPYRDERDLMMPGDRVPHQLLLTYKFTLAEAGEVTPRLPLLNRQVYDGTLESQMAMVFDAHKRRVLVSDIYPEHADLKKGDYMARVCLRHDNVALLEKLRDVVLVLERRLPTPVDVPLHATLPEALSGGKAFKGQAMHRGERVKFFAGMPPWDKLPKDAAEGRVMTGTLKWGPSDQPLGKAGLRYTVPPAPKKRDGGGAGDDRGASEKGEKELREAMRDAKVSFLKGLDPADAAQAELRESLCAEVLQEFPNHLPLLLEKLSAAHKRANEAREALASGSLTAEQVERLRGVQEAADAVVGAVDRDKVAIWAAMRCKEEEEKSSPEGKRLEEERRALVEALERRVQAGADVLDAGQGSLEELDKDMQALRAWVDTAEDAKYALLHARWELAHERPASALKCVDRKVKDEGTPSRETLEMRARVLDALGWEHWARKQRSAILDHFPPAYPLF